MNCYQAEPSFANLPSTGFKKSVNEKRTMEKSIIKSPGHHPG